MHPDPQHCSCTIISNRQVLAQTGINISQAGQYCQGLALLRTGTTACLLEYLFSKFLYTSANTCLLVSVPAFAKNGEIVLIEVYL